jgi:hypothetical protein
MMGFETVDDAREVLYSKGFLTIKALLHFQLTQN